MATIDVGAKPASPASQAGVREAFELPSGIYLYSHAVGCLPKVAREGATAYLNEWATRGGDAWEPWLGEVQRFNTALASLLNARVEDICPQVNLSSALTKIIQSLPKHPGRNKIVLSLLDFPTIGFVARQAERLGYEVVYAGAAGSLPAYRPEGNSANSTQCNGEAEQPISGPAARSSELDPRTALIDEKTALVLWTHAYPNTGTCIEPPTREQLQGAYLCVDIAQSAGVIPIDLGHEPAATGGVRDPASLAGRPRQTEGSVSEARSSTWAADFIIGSCVKFLCGGAGAGYLWVRPGLANDLLPTDVGWFSHARPFEFDIESFEYAPDAARFWGGTPSVVPYAIAARSIELLHGIGVESIRQHNLRLSQLLIDGALAKGVKVVSPHGPTQSATVVLDTGDIWEHKQRLNAAGIHCDARKYGLRLSPHIYNTEEEMRAVVELL